MKTRTKTGGRAKGTPNRTTAEIRVKYQLLIDEVIDKLKEDIESLEPKDRIRAIIELSKFVLPTLKATDLNIESGKAEFAPTVIRFVKYNTDENNDK